MDKYDIDMNRHYFAICDPNMHPKTDETYGWISASSQTTLTLAGEWLPLSSVVGVNFSTPSNGQTQVQISMYDGEPIYFGVKTVGDTTAIKAMNEVDWIQFSKNADGIHFHLSEISENELKIKIYSVSGQLIIEKELTNPLGDIDIPVSKIYSGILFCTVTGRVGTKTFKWSN